ncbi:Asp-tRNA(Asn)/Glu-tRNA(Gln) amidotransferase subunit GatB [Candidatus Peregrinibacteria bacterium]|jgi:aspartyl-tRNA(Asn)/glutamyl-tRNA(Gln) amidotransferase subunit B|nr:Asp-tRNA(Asn)/Glu-tRNA(Gln) amidotransferase subunit GatB [Candidatus Peregrinibacteria bacterium]MBT7703519.1 Asp-tRNA(Asn)/Glu-tRNA(Gln) amidotransferase subunit GatB [Candidatus Peregrinibacteria bacterium]
MTSYETVIGLEIHAQMNTKTKMFCACSNDSFGAKPNVNVCPICMGFPGMLPATNKKAIKKGVRTALAFRCNIPEFSKFDRKNYFYPDLPLGFQISQFDEPVSEKGYVEIETKEGLKKIGITRVHIENDAGKLTHTNGGSLVDFNRAGSPLMEIVTDPDMRSSEEAKTFAKMVQAILRTIGTSEADMEKGMMRFDASISTRPHGETKLYPRAEIKNLNSFRSLETALEYEIKRQINLWEEGNPLDGDITVGWLDDQQKTKLLRDKESSADYRYFPEPDLPPLVMDPQEIEEMKANIPELPLEKRQKFIEKYNISEEEALFFSEDPKLADFFEEVAETTKEPQKSASFVGTILLGRLKNDNKNLQDCQITAQQMAQLVTLVEEGAISNNQAKGVVFEAMFETGKDPEKIIEEKGLKQVSDTGAIEAIVDQVLSENPSAVEDFKTGKGNVLGFLIGQVMKASKGQANPGMVNEIMRKKLS